MVFCESGYDLARTRTLFLRICAICYSMAFLSLYPQISGLYGPNGILPVHGKLDPSPALNKNQIYSPSKLWELFKSKPTLLWYSGIFGLSPDLMMDFLCLIGTAIGACAAFWPSYGNKIAFIFMWLMYQSIYKVGETFLWFQWDILLLEVGFLCIIVAPWRGKHFFMARPFDHINMMLVRWLLFRMMFASGVVKLTSQCPTWWGLTAMPTHYESQCIPTPLAWNVFQLPEWMHKLSVAGTYFIEIGLVFLFFAPTSQMRKLSCLFQIKLMFVIMLTGNYNFFNLLFIGLCTSLFDDSWISKRIKFDSSSSDGFTSYVSKLTNVMFYFFIFYGWYKFFLDIDYDSSSPWVFSSWSVDLRVKFSKDEFANFVEIGTLFGIILGGISLAFSALMTLYKCINPSDLFARQQGCIQRLVSLFNSLFYIWIASGIYLMSIPVFTRGVGQPVPQPVNEKLQLLPQTLQHKVQELNLISSYGLFRRMTGVGGRPEVIIEGSDSMNGPWKEYHFMYKPGNMSESPKFVLPHQPRLDWQMWFAALGSYGHNPWFISLLYRILENKPEVMALLDQTNNPFPQRPPKYIRSKLYKYHFTKSAEDTDWWTREEVGEYSPIFSKDDPPQVKNYLVQSGILTPLKKNQQPTNLILVKILSFLRTQANAIPHHYLVWSVSWIVLPIMFNIQ